MNVLFRRKAFANKSSYGYEKQKLSAWSRRRLLEDGLRRTSYNRCVRKNLAPNHLFKGGEWHLVGSARNSHQKFSAGHFILSKNLFWLLLCPAAWKLGYINVQQFGVWMLSCKELFWDGMMKHCKVTSVFQRVARKTSKWLQTNHSCCKSDMNLVLFSICPPKHEAWTLHFSWSGFKPECFIGTYTNLSHCLCFPVSLQQSAEQPAKQPRWRLLPIPEPSYAWGQVSLWLNWGSAGNDLVKLHGLGWLRSLFIFPVFLSCLTCDIHWFYQGV